MPRAEYSQLLGNLRKRLAKEKVIQEYQRRSFFTEYRSVSLIERALTLSKNIEILRSAGISDLIILSSLQTEEGIQNLELYLLQTYIIPYVGKENLPRKILEFLPQSVQLQYMCSFVAENVEFQNWICAQNSTSFSKSVLIIFELYNTKKTLFSKLVKVIQTCANDLRFLFEHYTFFEIVETFTKIGDSDGYALFTTIVLDKFAEKHQRASWGTVLSQLDFITSGNPHRIVGETQWELRAAQSLYKENGLTLKSVDLARPELRKNAGGHLIENGKLREKGYEKIVPNPYLLHNPEQQEFYDYLEDPHHPLRHLLATIGVEVEAYQNPALNEKYVSIAEYVLQQGGFTFEFSARPVYQIETLIALYRKIFDSGLIDLLVRRDLSVHWNLGTENRTLTIKTHALMLLTGLVSTGRADEGIISRFKHQPENYFEWKQGNLLHSEPFLLGAEIYHSIATAQKAYEMQMETKSSVTITSDQFLLSKIYVSAIHETHKFLDEVGSALGVAITEEVLSGTLIGMEFSSRILLDVFPTIDSFIDIDPAEQLKKEQSAPPDIDSEKQYKRLLSLYVVAKAQEIVKDTHKKVREVLCRAEEDYSTQVVEIAYLILDPKTTLRDAKLIQKLELLFDRYPHCPTATSYRKSDQLLLQILMHLEGIFSQLLRKPGIDQEKSAILLNALNKVQALVFE